MLRHFSAQAKCTCWIGSRPNSDLLLWRSQVKSTTSKRVTTQCPVLSVFPTTTAPSCTTAKRTSVATRKPQSSPGSHTSWTWSVRGWASALATSASSTASTTAVSHLPGLSSKTQPLYPMQYQAAVYCSSLSNIGMIPKRFRSIYNVIWVLSLTRTLPLFFFPTAKSSTFVESCPFEEDNICGMIHGSGNRKWERRASVDGGPQTDFTNMGQCKGERRSVMESREHELLSYCCFIITPVVITRINLSTWRLGSDHKDITINW